MRGSMLSCTLQLSQSVWKNSINNNIFITCITRARVSGSIVSTTLLPDEINIRIFLRPTAHCLNRGVIGDNEACADFQRASFGLTSDGDHAQASDTVSAAQVQNREFDISLRLNNSSPPRPSKQNSDYKNGERVRFFGAALEGPRPPFFWTAAGLRGRKHVPGPRT